MNSDVIRLEEIDDYLRLVEDERNLIINLTIYKEEQERQLKRLESIKLTTERLNWLYKKLGKKPKRADVVDAIKKYARRY